MDEKYIEDVANKIVNTLTGKMTLAIAKKVIEKVEEKAAETGVNAVIAISNEGANLVAVHSMDDAYIASMDVAVNKAYTVVALKMSTIELKQISKPGDSLYGIQFTNGGKIVIFGGGDPLKIGDRVVGGIGVSGGTEEQDTMLSAYGKKVFEEVISCL